MNFYKGGILVFEFLQRGILVYELLRRVVLVFFHIKVKEPAEIADVPDGFLAGDILDKRLYFFKVELFLFLF
ncbi:MAG: hypothetical protein JXO48_11800 [Deltaproteobacteria bacterium]|nr:hypothetical protein [Deltaproteobacteria bacterium]